MFGVIVNDKKGSNKHFAKEIVISKTSQQKNCKGWKNIPRDFYLFNYAVNFLHVNMEYEFLRLYFHMYILRVELKFWKKKGNKTIVLFVYFLLKWLFRLLTDDVILWIENVYSN